MILETARLRLQPLGFADAAFILALVNEPSWLQYIGDRQVHSLDDARRYLSEGPLAMYDRHGFGLYRIERKSDGVSLGLCGLIQRETLETADIGYALLPAYWGQGYAFEAAQATLDYGNRILGLNPIAAITLPDNPRSITLLQRLGMAYVENRVLPGSTEVLALYRQR